MPHQGGFTLEFGLTALGDGPGKDGVALHHAAVFGGAVVSVLQLPVGVVQEAEELGIGG